MSTGFTRRTFARSVGLGAAGLCTGAVEAPAGAADQSPSAGDLDAFVRARIESAQVPGLSLAIIRDGKLQRATGFGFANLAQQRPMRADTLINVGSVTFNLLPSPGEQDIVSIYGTAVSRVSHCKR